MNIKVSKIRSALKISMFGMWIFMLTSLVVCVMMEKGVLPDDLWVFHRYITGFFGRVLLVSVIETSIIYFLYVLKKDKSISFLIYIFLFLCFLGLLIDNAGNLFGWFSVGKYYSVPWYDDFVHFSCAVIMSISLFFIYYNYSIRLKLNSKDNVLIISMLASLTSFGLGTVFGIYEYYSDIYFHTYMVGGVVDAITDNLYDCSGAAVAFIFLNTKFVRNIYINHRRV